MEYAVTYVSVALGTLLSAYNRFCRALMLRRRHAASGRFVSIRHRRWSSDLLWSVHFWRAVQASKWNAHDQSDDPVNWKGVLNMKDPFSLASYPILLAEVRPATIIEVGAFAGGSALWLADMLQILQIEGRVYSFDIDLDRVKARHPRVEFRWADSTDPASFDAAWLASLPRPWLIIEDAHRNVYDLLEFFAGMMRPADYIIVEDTNYPPKYRAMKQFMLDRRDEFLVDTRYTDLFGYNVTWHPNSVIRRM